MAKTNWFTVYLSTNYTKSGKKTNYLT